jgi:hypothetical protein
VARRRFPSHFASAGWFMNFFELERCKSLDRNQLRSLLTAKCKNVDRLMNVPTAPVFGCKQLFLVRPFLTQSKLPPLLRLARSQNSISLTTASRSDHTDPCTSCRNHCICCGNVVEGKIDLFTYIVVGQWLHLWERVTRRNLKKVIAQGALTKSGCLT